MLFWRLLKKFHRKLTKYGVRSSNVVSIIPFFVVFGVYSVLFLKTAYSDKEAYYFNYQIYADFLATSGIMQMFAYKLFQWPIEYPLFSGFPIVYHFGFMWLVGLVEHLIKDMVLALNLVSIFSLLWLLFEVSMFLKIVFHNVPKFIRNIMLLAFIINPSLEYIYVIGTLLKSGVSGIFILFKGLKTFFKLAPYRASDIILIFLNLNTLTNQRHMVLGFAILFSLFRLGILYFETQNKKYIVPIVLETFVLLLVHKALFLVWGVYWGLLNLHILVYKHKFYFRVKHIFVINTLLLSVAIIGSELIYNQLSLELTQKPIFSFGFVLDAVNWALYSMQGTSKLMRFLVHFIVNYSVYPLLALFGVFLSTKGRNFAWIYRRVLFIAAIISFIFAYSVQLSPDVAVNHKFINFAVYIFWFFTVYSLYYLYINKRILGVAIGVIIMVTSFINLIVDIVPYFNVDAARFDKEGVNPLSVWILENTEYNARFLNLTYNTMPVTLTGRRVYFGWDYFAWSAGYPTLKRREKIYVVLDSLPNIDPLCKLLYVEDLKYLYIPFYEELFIDRKIKPQELLGFLRYKSRWVFPGIGYVLSREDICNMCVEY